MSNHPGDRPIMRFQAYIWALILFLGFGLVGGIFLAVGGPGEDSTLRDDRSAERKEIVAETLKAQSAAISNLTVDEGAGTAVLPVEAGMALVLPKLKDAKPTKSEWLVPGSSTAMKQMQQPAAAPKEEAPAEEAPASEEETTSKDGDA